MLGTKRRKIGHVAFGNDDSEVASFASFSDHDDTSQQDDERDEQEHGCDSEGKENADSGNGRSTDTHEVYNASKIRSTASSSKRKHRTTDTPNHSLVSSAQINSSIFQLQVEALLERVRPQHGKVHADAAAAVHVLKKSIEQIPDRAPLSIDLAERQLINEGVTIPFPSPSPPKDAKYKLAYARPTNINVIGSFVLGTSPRTKQGVEVDLTLMMPSSLFEEKDFVNYRYFYKRSYYLACLAAGLKAVHSSDFLLRFRFAQDDPLKPILVVSPADRSENNKQGHQCTKWQVNLYTCVYHEQFSVERLKPGKSNLRKFTVNSDKANESKLLRATPFYNSSLRADMLMMRFLKLIHHYRKSCEGFLDACLLGSTWLHQRGFGSAISLGGFGSFEWAALIALCLPSRDSGARSILSFGYSSYQLFKAMLQFLASKDLQTSRTALEEAKAIKAVQDDTPLLWDSQNSHNLFYKMSPWSRELLRHEATTTLAALAALGDQTHDAFDATFILRVRDLPFRYDQVIEVPQAALFAGRHKVASQERISELYDVLIRGCGNRVYQIVIMTPSCNDWRLGSLPPDHLQQGVLRLCFMVDQTNIRRTVDHGPSADNKIDAAAFRAFWGHKAELRRFKDGSITESLIWTPNKNRQSVLEQIVQFLLLRHFDIALDSDTTGFNETFEKLTPGGVDLVGSQSLMALYNQFETDLRALQELPLSIRHIAAADPQLRYSSIRGPFDCDTAITPIPISVIVQFEGSAKWPDDLAAIQRTKIALLLQIKELLNLSTDLALCRIGLENEGQVILNQAFLEATYGSDASFRLRIHHDREQSLLERQLKDKSIDPKRKEMAAEGLAKYRREYLKTPAHTQAVAELCKKYPTLSGSIRLTKRWFMSHMLSQHIPEEVIELFVIRTFTQPWPWQGPSSIQAGFLRTLLWLSRWDWRVDPLIVNLSHGSSLQQPVVRTITTRFEAWRQLDPALQRVALFVASNLDQDGNTWTDGRPAVVIASRMTALAAAACAEVSSKGSQLDPASLFFSRMADFDFVINLNPGVCGTADKSNKKSIFKNLDLVTIGGPDQIGLTSAQEFFLDLTTAYGPAILFFLGGVQCCTIAGLWNPQTTLKSWKVNLACSTTPLVSTTDGEPLASINKSAVLSEIARLGGDIVRSIEVSKH